MNARLLELAEQSGIAKVLNQHAWEFGSGKFELDHYPELTKFAELVIAAYTPPPHPVYLASDGRFYEIPQRQTPLTEEQIYEILGYGAMAQYNSVPQYAIECVRAVEKAHGIS